MQKSSHAHRHPATNPIRRFFDFLAKMGLSVRDDPPRVIDLINREWGPRTDNFVLSAAAVATDDPRAIPALSIVLRNIGPAAVSLRIAPWLAFYTIEITGPEGAPVLLSPYGRELLKPERNTGMSTVALQPGAAAETQVPIGAVFALRPGHRYTVTVSCTLPVTNHLLGTQALII